MTRYDILPPSQRRLLPHLAELKDLGFVLYGGTAIALHLRHRVSVDFDFFSDRRMDRQALFRIAPAVKDAVILQDEPESFTVGATADASDPVKVSFFTGLGFGRVGSPIFTDDGALRLASPLDLLGHKLKVLLQRVERKDYTDKAALLRGGLTLSQGLGAARALFPNFAPCEAVRALVYFEGGDLRDLSPADRATLSASVREAAFPPTLPILSRTLV